MKDIELDLQRFAEGEASAKEGREVSGPGEPEPFDGRPPFASSETNPQGWASSRDNETEKAEDPAGEANAGAEAEPAVPVPEELLREKREKEAAAPPPEGPPEEPEPEPAGIEPEPEQEPDAGGGPSVEERIAALEEALQKQNELLLRREQDLVMRQHFSALEQQGEAMKEHFPAFDLRAELADPMFVRLTSPGVGLSVEDAYYALHHGEITAAGAQAAAEMLGNSVKAGKAMPAENGGVQRGAPEGFRPLAELSPEERKLRMEMIRSGKLRFD